MFIVRKGVCSICEQIKQIHHTSQTDKSNSTCTLLFVSGLWSTSLWSKNIFCETFHWPLKSLPPHPTSVTTRLLLWPYSGSNSYVVNLSFLYVHVFLQTKKQTMIYWPVTRHYTHPSGWNWRIPCSFENNSNCWLGFRLLRNYETLGTEPLLAVLWIFFLHAASRKAMKLPFCVGHKAFTPPLLFSQLLQLLASNCLPRGKKQSVRPSHSVLEWKPHVL